VLSRSATECPKRLAGAGSAHVAVTQPSSANIRLLNQSPCESPCSKAEPIPRAGRPVVLSGNAIRVWSGGTFWRESLNSIFFRIGF
jgi:hypothetical protein